MGITSAREQYTAGTRPYEKGQRYPVTEVLGWWIDDIAKKPQWIPVMGTLHENAEFFQLPTFHHHVDPRFLSPEVEQETTEGTESGTVREIDRLHLAYQHVLTDFALEDGTRHFKINAKNTVIRYHTSNELDSKHPREWVVYPSAPKSKSMDSETCCSSRRRTALYISSAVMVQLSEVGDPTNGPAVTGEARRNRGSRLERPVNADPVVVENRESHLIQVLLDRLRDRQRLATVPSILLAACQVPALYERGPSL